MGKILPTSGILSYRLDIRKIAASSILMAIADGEILK
jgi:hypothetical protein